MRIDIIIKVLVAVIGLIKVVLEALEESKKEGGDGSSKKQYRI